MLLILNRGKVERNSQHTWVWILLYTYKRACDLAFKYMYTCPNDDTYVYRHVWARLHRCIPCVWAQSPLHKSVSWLLWIHRQVKVIVLTVCTYTCGHSAYVAMNQLCVFILPDMNRIAMHVYIHIQIRLMFTCTCGHDHAYGHIHKWTDIYNGAWALFHGLKHVYRTILTSMWYMCTWSWSCIHMHFFISDYLTHVYTLLLV